MKGDFSRDSFSSRHGYTPGLSQQGRVQLDADWNEQISILWDYWRSMVIDLVGPHAGPHGRCGFEIFCPAELSRVEPASERRELNALLKEGGDFLISPGNYYVDG